VEWFGAIAFLHGTIEFCVSTEQIRRHRKRIVQVGNPRFRTLTATIDWPHLAGNICRYWTLGMIFLFFHGLTNLD
jgi:hypothetical protein